MVLTDIRELKQFIQRVVQGFKNKPVTAEILLASW